MSSRIQELIAKANGTPVELVEITSWTFAERLAELVVRECADIATINSHQYHPAGDFVLTHFGVE